MHVVMHVVKEALIAATLSLPLPSAADGAFAETSVVLHYTLWVLGAQKVRPRVSAGFYSLR